MPHLQSLLKTTNLPDLQTRIHWILRVTTALCFIGHGSWGVITKAGWLPFFASQGIPESIAWKLMPIIGIFDITLGILLLLKPNRAILMTMFLWALWTAILRPISGTPGMWEFWERAGNFVPPLMLLIMAGPFAMTIKDWFYAYKEPRLTEQTLKTLEYMARMAVALLLIGHGGFGAFVQKSQLVHHWNAIGVAADIGFIQVVGYIEIIAGICVLFMPFISFMWAVLIWKIFSEVLYIFDGGFINIFEFIERWGDYGLPLTLVCILYYYVYSAQNQQMAYKKEGEGAVLAE